MKKLYTVLAIAPLFCFCSCAKETQVKPNNSTDKSTQQTQSFKPLDTPWPKTVKPAERK